jgi:hypothetical protein
VIVHRWTHGSPSVQSSCARAVGRTCIDELIKYVHVSIKNILIIWRHQVVVLGSHTCDPWRASEVLSQSNSTVCTHAQVPWRGKQQMMK